MVVVSAPKRLAVLIDGDNLPSSLADSLFEQVAKFGSIAIRRLYGGSAAITGWRAMSSKHAIRLHEVLPGKNATDMRLAIDAMDVLHGGKVDGFCIVSSDNDFAELATRLREDGVAVIGFGGTNAAAGFKRACDQFVVLGKAAVAEKVVQLVSVEAETHDLAWLLSRAIAGASADNSEATLTAVGQHLRQLKNGFSYKDYGASNLKTLLQKAKLQVRKNPAGILVVMLPLAAKRTAA